MTGEEALARIRKSLQRSVEETPAAKSLIEKIRSGKATYQDTALYARWAATNLGLSLSHVVCDIDLSDRAAVCKALLLDQYEDINGFVDMVQAELDSSFGIHLAPQRAPFEAERADTIGQSLADTTKPDDVIRRRAQSATATATKAIHDDRMKAEARFRSRAGLKCYITRTAVGGCCPWCSEVAGRYEYGEEPDDIYRRHDNCDCTVTFENGRQRQDVWSKRTWEAPAEDAGAAEATVFTDETRPNGTQVTVFSPLTAEERQQSVLTLSHISATIEVGSIPDQFKRYVPPREERIAIIQRGIQNPDAVFSDGRLASFARCLEPLEGYYDVVMHGNAESIQFFDTQIDVQTLGAIIMGRKDYQRGTKIRLISCETGKGAECVAKYLSEMLGVEVLAPTEKVTIMMPVGGKSSMIVQSGPHKRDGEWKKFGGSEE